MTWADPPLGNNDVGLSEADLSLATELNAHSDSEDQVSPTSTGRGGASTSADREVGHRIARAVVALAVRQGFVKVVSVVGAVILARILDPSTFGAYAIVSFAVALFTLVGDMGLAATLIQQEHEPSEHELRVAFTAQQLALGAAAVLVWVLSSDLVERFRLAQEAEFVVKVLAVGLLVSSLRTIPSTLLERRLQFGSLAVAEGAQVVGYQTIAIVLAATGHGIASFGVAALVATTMNTIIVNLVIRWRPRWGWDWPLLIQMFRFGIPYQGSAAVSFIKDAINPIFIGLMIGALAVGYVNWAVTVIGYPLLLVSILNRLYFPAFSRLRRDGEALAKLAAAIMRWGVFLVIGLIVPFLLEAEFWTRLVFGPQWVPAIPLLYYLAIAMPFAAAASPGMAILNAFGRSHDVFVFTIVWLVATWALTVPAVALFGWIGFGLANALVTLSAPFFFRRVQACVPVPIWGGIVRALASAMLAWMVQVGMAALLPAMHSGIGMVVFAIVAAFVYVATWLVFSIADVRRDVAIARSIRRSSATAST